MTLPHWISIADDCNPALRSLVEGMFAGSINYACGSCGITPVPAPGEICEACKEPEAA